jgi:hypothetical protein
MQFRAFKPSILQSRRGVIPGRFAAVYRSRAYARLHSPPSGGDADRQQRIGVRRAPHRRARIGVPRVGVGASHTGAGRSFITTGRRHGAS